jgi:hypothetical protein
MKKTYTTLAGAYAAAEKANATRFDLTYNGGMVLGVLEQVYKHANKMTVAKNNLVKYEKMLCALECVHTKDRKTAYKWTVVGHFDNEGLLYANVPTSEKTEDKPKATPRTRKPKSTKGDSKAIDFNAFKGTKSEKNRALHAELVSRGMKDSRTDEYQSIWTARPWAKA